MAFLTFFQTISVKIGPCTHPQGESECPVCRWLSVPHSQDNDPKEPPKREEDTLTKHNLGGFPRTRRGWTSARPIVSDNNHYASR